MSLIITDSNSTLRCLQGSDVFHVNKHKAKVKTVGNVVIIEYEEDYLVADNYANITPSGASAVAVADLIGAMLDNT